ncbi:LLM class flavin-dependent oxidoreductase [Actinomycetospora termitidis]|uniref:LLM class flavin-dependent oxidoreductase n=1 Tax=Actinomycetospora termitidis TaxID=3053470 RepID=A0ABT7M9L5_9PSEU|nr:LLM class flavin-dependent oxidoreductase [Actinomycetospora sp. Odt1-22]MDL5156103.1 LLM class flavin-dependent oxidoreductase [Actinomycetospora sp. Odt1-22]
MFSSPTQMRFGVFLGPYHRPGLDPNLALHRDLDLAVHLDRLGFDEIWFGEHHSGGVETIASPEVMIAAAAQRTSRIRLGTGVSSLPYHQPFILADRIVQLDHLTRGRMAFGVGPGQLLEDATMIGIEPSTQRARMEQALDVMMRLFAGETVTAKTEWFTLQDAVLQLPRYSDFEVAVTGSISAAGPSLAGKHGVSLLSLAATDPTGTDRLAGQWQIVEEEAARSGHIVKRENWRLLGPMHIAETVEQAKKDVAYGMPWIMNYLSHITPASVGSYDTVDELVDMLNETGRGVVGTPDMAVAQLLRLQERSGGFGTYLFQGSDYARWPATLRSYELFAEEVIPRMNGRIHTIEAAVERTLSSGTAGADATRRSQAEATAQYRASRGLS